MSASNNDENPHLSSFHPKLHCSQKKKEKKKKKPLKHIHAYNVSFPGYGVD